MATTSRSSWRSRMALRVWRPMRPNPLIPMRVTRETSSCLGGWKAAAPVGRVAVAFIDDRERADQRHVVTVLGQDHPHAACRGGERAQCDLVVDDAEQLGPMHRDGPTYHDDLGVEDIDQAGAHGTDGRPPTRQH